MNLTYSGGRGGGGRGGGGRGRESLVKWNLVTDASEGGAVLLGRVEVACVCACARPCACIGARVNVCACGRAGVAFVCVCARSCRKGTGHERTLRERLFLLGVIISRFPPKPFFHLKRLVAAD